MSSQNKLNLPSPSMTSAINDGPGLNSLPGPSSFKKKRKGKSPTARTLEYLRSDGYICADVSKFVRYPPPGHRVDAFGIADIIAVNPEKMGTTFIQVTSDNGGNMMARVRKIIDNPILNNRLKIILGAGNFFWVCGWKKSGPRGMVKRWNMRRIDINEETIDNFKKIFDNSENQLI